MVRIRCWFGLFLGVAAGMAASPGAFSSESAGPRIEAVSPSGGVFEMTGGVVLLRARVTREGQPVSGQRVNFWITQDPSKPSKLKKETTTPGTFYLESLIPEGGVREHQVVSDEAGIAEVRYRLGSKSGHNEITASVDGLCGQPAIFTVEAGQMPIIVITLLGGLGMFIFGMNLMGDSLQTWAGERMRSILSFFTRNRVVALISGILITFVLQSSSACTVLLVGFVNSGLMTLAQSIGVILGADIGTTLTVQLIAFDVGQFALAFVFLGFVFIFFTKKESLNYLGRVLIGFGLLFYGLKVMGGSMSPLSKYEPFISILRDSTSSPLMGLLASTALTAVIQSSAATIAIAIGLAMQLGPDGAPLLGIEQTIPIIFGANIGTCATAVLASFGTSRNAKRVALAHTLFKVCGVIIFMFLLGPLSDVVRSLGGTINRQIANAHTIFNVAMALLFLPLSAFFGKLILLILPEREEKAEVFGPIYLASDLTRHPAIAIEQTKKELERMAEIASGMCGSVIEAFRRKDPEFVDSAIGEFKKIEILEGAIRPYLAEIGGVEMGPEVTKAAVALMNISNEYLQMGRVISQDLLPLAEPFIAHNLFFSPEGWGQLQDYGEKVTRNVHDATAAFRENNLVLAGEITERKPTMIRLEKQYTRDHFERLRQGHSEAVETSTLHMGLISGLRRVNSSATNIAYDLLDK